MFAQRFSENPELKVYVEDALQLVLAARPERPLDVINDYLQRSVRKMYIHTRRKEKRAAYLCVCRTGKITAYVQQDVDRTVYGYQSLNAFDNPQARARYFVGGSNSNYQRAGPGKCGGEGVRLR